MFARTLIAALSVSAISTVLAMPASTIFQRDGECASSSDCAAGYCCSQYGYCGQGTAYCGSSGGGSSSGGSGSGTTYSGEATVNPNPTGADGSCGDPFLDSQFKVALSNSFMNGQYDSPYCGRQITLTNTGPNGDNSVGGEGNTITVTVDDTCEGCDEGHLDLSVAAWNALTNNAAYSHVGITWHFD